MSSIKVKKDIRTLSEKEFDDFFENSLPSYRYRQVLEWLWTKGVSSFEEMTSLPKNLREELSAHFTFNQTQSVEYLYSNDGTIKCGIQLHDKNYVESVLIPTEKRMTACISSQVGCSLSCTFCATGKLKMKRNLEVYEIFEQVKILNKISVEKYDKPLTNLVFMGMGEPLLNIKNVMTATEHISECEQWNLSMKKIVVSSVGIPKIIYKIADKAKFNLAISLHTADINKRMEYMPHSKEDSLIELKKALKYWYQQTKSKILFEYIVWKGINETQKDIELLKKYVTDLPCKVNLISYNSIEGEGFAAAPEKTYLTYQNQLEKIGVTTKIRRSRGQDIMAACGQLANQMIN